MSRGGSGSEATPSSIQAALDAHSKRNAAHVGGSSSQAPPSYTRENAEHLNNLPPELRSLFPRNPEEINKIIERAAKGLPNFGTRRASGVSGAHTLDDEVEGEVDRVLREVEEESEGDVEASIEKRSREALSELERIELEVKQESRESKASDVEEAEEAKGSKGPKINVDDDDDDDDLDSGKRSKKPWKELSKRPPGNMPDHFPSHIYEPYADVEEPLDTSATAEFEAAFAYHPKPIGEANGVDGENPLFDDPIAATLRAVMLETHDEGDMKGVDEQVRLFMSELEDIGGDPTYENPFEALDLDSAAPIGQLATGLDDVVGELGDFAANPDIFKEFASLLQTERTVDVDGPGAVVDLAEEDAVGVSLLAQREWEKLERQAAQGAIDFVSDAAKAKEAAEEMVEKIEMEASEKPKVDYAEGGPEDVLLGKDPWSNSYEFPKVNSYRILIPMEALEKGLAARFTASPEVVLGHLEASLDAIPGREALSDAKRGWAWLNLGLHHAEEGAVGRAVAALREASHTRSSAASGDAKLSDEEHPLRIVARATAELALIYGRGLDSRRALLLVHRWLTLAAEIWGEDAVMADDPDANEVEDDDELALTDSLRSRLKDALERHSDDADALGAASILHTLARDAPRAKDALLAAAHARPGEPLAWRRLAAVQSPGADAVRALRRAADLRPFYSASWTRVGHAYAAVHNYERAAPYLLRALALLQDSMDVDDMDDDMEGDTNASDVAEDKAAPVWAALTSCVQALGHHELEHSIRQKDVDGFRAYFTF